MAINNPAIKNAILIPNFTANQAAQNVPTIFATVTLPLMKLADAEKALVKLALDKADGNAPKAAILLGLTKASMYRRLEKYGLAKN